MTIIAIIGIFQRSEGTYKIKYANYIEEGSRKISRDILHNQIKMLQ